jgi:N-terminal domain of anti-restriction factor ArdC
LIALDCWSRGITPTYVAGFRAFLDLNRCVRKGEKAIRILAPVTVKQRDANGEETGEKKVFFRTVPVFDTLSRARWERGQRRCRGVRAAASS